MSLGEQILLTLRSTQVLRLFLVGSYFSILSVLYSVVCIIVSPFVIYCLAITLCICRFTNCDYSFGIFKLNKAIQYIIDLGNTDICWKRMVDLYAAFLESFFPIDQTVSEEISFLCLTDKKL